MLHFFLSFFPSFLPSSLSLRFAPYSSSPRPRDPTTPLAEPVQSRRWRRAPCVIGLGDSNAPLLFISEWRLRDGVEDVRPDDIHGPSHRSFVKKQTIRTFLPQGNHAGVSLKNGRP